VVGIAALPPGLAEQARRWSRRLPGSLLPLSGGWPAMESAARWPSWIALALLSTRSPPRAGPAGVRQAFGLRRPSVGNAGSGSWTRRSPPLLSRWGTCMTCKSISVRQPLVSFDGVSEMRRRPVPKRSSLGFRFRVDYQPPADRPSGALTATCRSLRPHALGVRTHSNRSRSGALTVLACFARSTTRSRFYLVVPALTLTVDPANLRCLSRTTLGCRPPSDYGSGVGHHRMGNPLLLGESSR
jgi:hypothetical protein